MNIEKIHKIYEDKQKFLHNLKNWINSNWVERLILDDLLDFLTLEQNDETRFTAYQRIAELKEEPLKLYLENNFWKEEVEQFLEKAYIFTSEFHEDLHEEFLHIIKEQNLVSDFYFEILNWVFEVWKEFSKFFIVWHKAVLKQNNFLDKKFDNNSSKIMDFLREKNLLDKSEKDELDRCYSLLEIEESENISVKTYIEKFPLEAWMIIEKLGKFINKLEFLEDEEYNKKEEYINYLEKIKNAFLEKNPYDCFKKWQEVDEVWMKIDTPFQIWHPLEFYEDKYRKAVAPEWDLRLASEEILNSKVSENILKMYEKIFSEEPPLNPLLTKEGKEVENFRGGLKEKYKESYNFSLENQKRVQLYISNPILYFGSELTGLFSAQVVPNDEEITKKYWKKIFAFPKFVLESQRNNPFMKLQSLVFEESILKKYKEILFWSDKLNYNIYDIETIGHEYGHTLWLTENTEVKMNKTGVFKNIEEFKATAWGLVAYFSIPHLNPLLLDKRKGAAEEGEIDEIEMDVNIIVTHLVRCVGLLKYREVVEVVPYYAESLIHLDILFESKIIYFEDDKVFLELTQENIEILKKKYLYHYKKLINIYLEKKDAGEFLFQYVVEEKGNYLPKNNDLKKFVENYYELYKKIGNEVL